MHEGKAEGVEDCGEGGGRKEVVDVDVDCGGFAEMVGLNLVVGVEGLVV